MKTTGSGKGFGKPPSQNPASSNQKYFISCEAFFL